MSEISYVDLPVKEKIQKTYELYEPFLNDIMLNVEKQLQKSIRLSSQPTYKTRVKSFDSYYKKILRVKPRDVAGSDTLVCLTDMIGIRIICAFLEDLSGVQDQIKHLFKVREIENKSAAQNFREFGYESIHVLIEIPQNCFPEIIVPGTDKKYKIPQDLVCEIQIRTILQDAWAEVEHELIYKSEFSPFDMPLRRKLASINASLTLADIIFQEIRDYQKKLQTEMEERRKSFYGKADKLDIFSEEKPTDKPVIERVSPYVKGTIDDLLLEAIHAHNTGDLERAINIYSFIIDSQPKPDNIVLSVIRKHRGMAYFARSDYEKALDDFKESAELDPKNFRSAYYEGIVFAILKRYNEAVLCYTKSLELNEYQSHTFFRRAVAYYEMNEYEKALNDITAARKLGMNDDSCKTLHDRLIEKLDMKM
jgi:putative GTP pyrophosphokinase